MTVLVMVLLALLAAAWVLAPLWPADADRGSTPAAPPPGTGRAGGGIP